MKAAIQATGRKKLIITGISTEVCLAFPAISATAEGYDAYGAIDASGTFSQAKREAGLLRMQQAGVILIDYATARQIAVITVGTFPQRSRLGHLAESAIAQLSP